MAPPRRIVRPQLDMLINFLEDNRDAIHGGPQGGTSIAVTRKKWMVLAKKLNSVQGGTMKTPEAWKKVSNFSHSFSKRKPKKHWVDCVKYLITISDVRFYHYQ